MVWFCDPPVLGLRRFLREQEDTWLCGPPLAPWSRKPQLSFLPDNSCQIRFETSRKSWAKCWASLAADHLDDLTDVTPVARKDILEFGSQYNNLPQMSSTVVVCLCGLLQLTWSVVCRETSYKLLTKCHLQSSHAFAGCFYWVEEV